MTKAHRNTHNTYIRSYLIEALMSSDFKESELKVILWLCRNTYGYRTKKGGPQRDRTTAPYEKIAEETNQHKDTVGRALRSLEKMNVITIYKKPVKRSGEPGTFGLNSDNDTWVLKERTICKKSKTLKDRTICKNTSSDLLKPKIDLLKTEENGATTPPAARRLRSKDNVDHITQGEGSEKAQLSDPLQALDPVRKFALKIFQRLGEKYYPITGPPQAKFSDCLTFAKLTAHDQARASEALGRAYRSLWNWEAQAGRQSKRPFDTLNDAARLFREGWSTDEYEQPEYYDPATDPDLQPTTTD